MSNTVASAPGKVVLCGEYAVLFGAPAVAMAIDRRAQVRVTEYDGDWHRVVAPGYSAAEGRFLADGAAIDWLQGESDYALVDAAWWTVGSTAAIPVDRHLSIELDTRAFIDKQSGNKVGIGSSAALTVALVAALLKSSDVLPQALQAHAVLQHGAGSGVDIATSASSGLVLYRMANADVTRLCWPDGLACRLLWTGVPVSTQTKLERLRKKASGTSVNGLVDAAETMSGAWQSAATVLSQYPDYIEALRRFSVDHDLGVFDAGHDRLVNAAAAAGLVYKPCGAGGGDVGILLGAGEEQLDAFLDAGIASGCRVLDCAIDHGGIVLEAC
ncbi:MAG: hypothetical protein HKN64_03200 [Woeseiaceae bacterium]|nr:hypothetical protein [Woeseiaceae bacterium]